MLAIYTRLSRDDDESNSIENQTREGIAFAKDNNYPYKIYNEGKGVSGTQSIEKRPVLDKLTKDIINGDIKAFWVRNQNRLERDSATFHTFIKIAKRYDIKVFYGDKLMDVNDPSIMLQNSILSALNQYQAELQSYQTKKALLDNIKEGKASGGILPYGYKSDENKMLAIDEDEAKVVRKIFSMSLEGKGQKSISRWLNDNDVPTRYNKFKGTLTTKNKYTGKKQTKNKNEIKWSDKAAYDIITNPIYKGERRWSGKTYVAPAIITPEYWQKVNDNLKNNRTNTGKKVDHKYLLKGLLRCAKCGRNYYGRSKTNDPCGYIDRISKTGKKRRDYNHYLCASKRYSYTNCGSKNIKMIDLDSLIWGVFFEEKVLINKLQEYIKSLNVNKQVEEANIKAAKLVEKIDDLSFQKQRAIDLAIKGIVSEDEIRSQLNSIKSKLANYDEELNSIRNYIYNIENSSLVFSDKLTQLSNVKTNISFQDKQQIIHEYIEDIVIYTFLDDPTNSFIQVNVYYKGIGLTPDKFIFNLEHGIAVNVFNEKVISINQLIDKEYFLKLIQPLIVEIKNVQK